MKFSCGKKTFSDAVNIIQRAVSTKSTLPALEGILIKAANDSLTLTSNDLEIGMTTTIPATVSESGDIVLNAKLFSKFFESFQPKPSTSSPMKSFLPPSQAVFPNLQFSEFRQAEFPETPALTECENFSISQSILAGMIRQTLFCISSDDSKPVHTGSLFELSER